MIKASIEKNKTFWPLNSRSPVWTDSFKAKILYVRYCRAEEYDGTTDEKIGDFYLPLYVNEDRKTNKIFWVREGDIIVFNEVKEITIFVTSEVFENSQPKVFYDPEHYRKLNIEVYYSESENTINFMNIYDMFTPVQTHVKINDDQIDVYPDKVYYIGINFNIPVATGANEAGYGKSVLQLENNTNEDYVIDVIRCAGAQTIWTGWRPVIPNYTTFTNSNYAKNVYTGDTFSGLRIATVENVTSYTKIEHFGLVTENISFFGTSLQNIQFIRYTGYSNLFIPFIYLPQNKKLAWIFMNDDTANTRSLQIAFIISKLKNRSGG